MTTMALPARRRRPTRARTAEQKAFQSFVETQRLLGKLEQETQQLAQDAHDRLHEMRGMKKDLRKLLRMVNHTVWVATIGTTLAGAIFTLTPMLIPNSWKQQAQSLVARLHVSPSPAPTTNQK